MVVGRTPGCGSVSKRIVIGSGVVVVVVVVVVVDVVVVVTEITIQIKT